MKLVAFLLAVAVGLTRAVAPARKPLIAVAMIGDAPRSLVDELAPILRETFGAEVVAAPPMPLTPGAWNASRGQYLSTALLDRLADARKPEWERLLGIAEVDLYVPDLNVVFGEADRERGVAVFSVDRLRSGADEALLVRRAATEAVHELGHTWGLSHCSKPTCVMWFSNTLAETDRKGFGFCAEHARQRARNRGGSAPGASPGGR